MRTTLAYDPFYRSAFNRLFDLIDEAGSPVAGVGPAYDIVRAGDDAVRLTLAVPGFAKDELDITMQPNVLIVSGNKREQTEDGYLHRGIDTRSFTRRFALADHVEVVGADMKDGLLSIELRRELPEALKPRRIAIGMGDGDVQHEQRQIEGHKQAA